MTVKTFIDRPILAGVISVVIVIIGMLGLVQLPIEHFLTLTRVYASESLSRFNLFPAISVCGEQGEVSFSAPWPSSSWCLCSS